MVVKSNEIEFQGVFFYSPNQIASKQRCFIGINLNK